MELRTRLGPMSGDVQQDLKTLQSFVFQQSEELRYLMHNLDVTNFNDLGLARYENGRLQIYTEQLNIKAEKLTAEFQAADEKTKTTLEASVKGLRTEVEEEIEGLGVWVSEVEQTAQGIETTVKSHTTKINTINNTTIPNLSSRITQNANSISLVVSDGSLKAASIVTAINNMGSSEVKISADRVNISGVLTIDGLNNGTTTIDGGWISGNAIEGVELRTTGEYNDPISIKDDEITIGESLIVGDGSTLRIMATYPKLEGFIPIISSRSGSVHFYMDRDGDRFWELTENGFVLWEGREFLGEIPIQ